MTFISYAQNFEDVMLWRVFNGIGSGFYIDVGAHDPSVDSVTLAFYERGWHGINIEPVNTCHERVAAHRPRDINLNVALGENAGELPFYEVLGTGMSSLSAAIADQHRDNGFSIVTGTVLVRTLAEVCAEHAPSDIHFLKIDVEGAERAVLAGADFVRFRPWVILVEATEPNSPEPNHYGWEPLLLAGNYEFVWFDGLNRFYIANERASVLKSFFVVPPNVFDDFNCCRYIEMISPDFVGKGTYDVHFDQSQSRRIAIDLYNTLLMRQPDRSGLEANIASLMADGALSEVLKSIITSPEFKAKLPEFCRCYGLELPVQPA